jgi:hypothetical protein
MNEPWIQTFTGRKAEPFHLKPDQVCIEDIAHALSNICRFGGHCRNFYSVAQHSVQMSWAVWTDNPLPAVGRAKLSLCALMHDAAEAYLGDVVRPLKELLCVNMGPNAAAFDECEVRAQWAIQVALGLPGGTAFLKTDELKLADLRMLATERRDLMSLEPEPWMELPEPYSDRITEGWSASNAEVKFRLRYSWLQSRVAA